MSSTRLLDCAGYRLIQCIFYVCPILFTGLGLYSVEKDRADIRFNRDIRPILSDNCYLCHGFDHSTRKADLRLDLEEGITASLGPDRQVVVPGSPDKSELIKRINAQDADDIMPPPSTHKQLTAKEKQLLKDWITEGAEWEDHWSYTRIERPTPPTARDPAWITNAVDQFILKRLDTAGLTPSATADRRTLIRRVSLDLRGLPPTQPEIDDFLADDSENAYAAMVDRFLATPEYGEHRARYWLDAARYSDTHGFHLDNYRSIWPYRDWVIKAFNDNMPFDQFTIEQIAGDLLPDATLSQKIATGFNRCNPTTSEGGAIDEEYLAIYAKDRVETTSTVWLGMTMGCASCHDHKFDPVSQKEFYQMSAFFRNTTQKAMDGNSWDTPPSVKLYTGEQDHYRKGLKKDIGRLKKVLSHIQMEDQASYPDLSSIGKDAMRWKLDTSGGEIAFQCDSGEVAVPADDLYAEVANIGALEITSGTNLEVGDHADLDKDNPFTLSFWIKVPKEKLSNDLMLFGRYDPGKKNQGWNLQLMKNQSIKMTFADDSDPQYSFSVISQSTLKPDEWNHVVISYNALYRYDSIRTYNTAFELFVNGKKIGYRGVNGKSKLYGSIHVDKPFVRGRASPLRKKQPPGNDDPPIALASIKIFDQVLIHQEKALLACEIQSGAIEFEKPEKQAQDSDGPASQTTEVPQGDLLTALRDLRLAERKLAVLESSVPVTLVMDEKKDSQPEAHILDRGQYDLPGEKVGPDVPKILPPLPQANKADRLQLAEWLVDPENPLPARVTVNRFWQELFGTGIVRTSEDFGSQGEPPSHPELLDWLAAEFMESGWDIKHMYKLLMMSSTYRQSSNLRPELIASDPENRLLARGPRFRLDAEIIRDQALFLSQLLVGEMGGPPVKPYQPNGVWSAVAYTGSNTARFEPDSGEKLYRRSLYTFWKRTAPPPSMSIFDAPSRESCSVRREITNTPLQALVLMNDPQFVEASRNLAEIILQNPGDDKVSLLLSITLGNPQSEEFRRIVRKSYTRFRESYESEPKTARELIHIGESEPDRSIDPVELAAWTMVASQVMNLDAFIMKN